MGPYVSGNSLNLGSRHLDNTLVTAAWLMKAVTTLAWCLPSTAKQQITISSSSYNKRCLQVFSCHTLSH